MARGKAEADDRLVWNYVAHLMAEVRNTTATKESQLCDASEINPYRKPKKRGVKLDKDSIHLLKHLAQRGRKKTDA